MADRFDIERRLRRSGLPAPARAIVRVLCERIDRDTGRIPDNWQPSYRTLAADTGYSRRTVVRHVQALAALGWVELERHGRGFHARSHQPVRYQITPPGASDRLTPALVPQRHSPSDSPAPDLVPERHSASDTAAHSQESSRRPSSGVDEDLALARIAVDELRALTGRQLDERQGAEVARLVLDGRRVSKPGPYLRRALRSDPGRYAPAPSNQPPPLSEVLAEQRRLVERDRGADG